MKVFILFSALLCGLSQANKYQKNVCVNTDEVHLPNPEDCGSYIQCIHHYPYLIQCPGGLHWSVTSKQCDWPSVAKCNYKQTTHSFSKQWTNCDDVPEDIDVLLPNPNDCGSYIQCVHQQPEIMPCPDGLHWSVATNTCEEPWEAKCNVLNTRGKKIVQSKRIDCKDVPENVNVLQSNPEDCGSFIQCTNKEPIIMKCPEGLHWGNSTNRCEYPWIAKCNTSNAVPSLLKSICEGVPEDVNVLLPNPSNCSTFLQCVHQKPEVMECPFGLHWCVQTKSCDVPSLARCNSTRFGKSQSTMAYIRNLCEELPEHIDVLLPNLNYCGTYIQCVHQKPIVRLCPFGLHWSAAAKRCMGPLFARCKLQPHF